MIRWFDAARKVAKEEGLPSKQLKAIYIEYARYIKNCITEDSHVPDEIVSPERYRAGVRYCIMSGLGMFVFPYAKYLRETKKAKRYARIEDL